jgi:hypothetical protein
LSKDSSKFRGFLLNNKVEMILFGINADKLRDHLEKIGILDAPEEGENILFSNYLRCSFFFDNKANVSLLA